MVVVVVFFFFFCEAKRVPRGPAAYGPLRGFGFRTVSSRRISVLSVSAALAGSTVSSNGLIMVVRTILASPS